MAVLTDPTEVRRAGETAVAPNQYTQPGTNPYLRAPTGYTPTDWTKLIQGNSGYMNWALSAAERKDVAAANRKAALQALAVRYGGLPEGFKDPYGDISEDILGQARANPLSESARLSKSYADSIEQTKRSLAARGALQSGELGYGLGQIDYQRSADIYDLGQQFMGTAQGAINQYSDALSGLSAEQISSIRQAAMDAYNAGYRGGGASLAGGGGMTGTSGRFQYTPGSLDKISSYGFSDEEFEGIISEQLAARGYGPYMGPGGLEQPRVARDGELFMADGVTPYNGQGDAYAWVKVGVTPDGNSSTEMFNVGVPPNYATPAPPPPPQVAPPPAAPTVYPIAAPPPTMPYRVDETRPLRTNYMT